MNHHIETDVLRAEGRAYGVELMVKKNARKVERLGKLYLLARNCGRTIR